MPLKIYYLDDERELCENFFDEFDSKEFKVSTFVDPSKFIEGVKESKPDLIFIDYRLPSTTGDKIAEKLGLRVPTYLITGEVLVVTSYNFTKRLKKPYNSEEVREILRTFQGK
jgi:FixJ family two-component response regulator